MQKKSFAAAVRAAFPHTIPIMTGYLAVGLAYGVLMASKGYNALWSGFVSAFAANKMLADQGLAVATATGEQIDAINKAAGPYGILSVILIIIAGAVLYFAVLPRTLKGDQRKI